MSEIGVKQSAGGILIRGSSISDVASSRLIFLEKAGNLGIVQLLETTLESGGMSVRFRPHMVQQGQWPAACDTLQLCEKFGLYPQANSVDLETEILLSMLLGPVLFEFPSYAEFAAAIRIRRNIVEAARRTVLAFHTCKIERPRDYWIYTKERGFTILPGKHLVEALRKATQPDLSGEKYAFSCYRATEYVILLALAEEIASCNPALSQQLQLQWESRAIMSRQFHDVFLIEFGSMDEPLPPRYYIPGDRLWFRNPDERSADISGYEGSWVFYLGNGLFSNFWERDKPYTLVSKCIEIFHWRHGAYQDDAGTLQMDEAVVEECVRTTMGNPAEVERILERMMRLRDPQGVYADGGCIDTSREFPRCVCPGSVSITLPEN